MDPEFKDEETALILEKILLFNITKTGNVNRLPQEVHYFVKYVL